MDYNSLIKTIISTRSWLTNESFKPALFGTIHKVYLSNKYVLRLRLTDTGVLDREAQLLIENKNPLMPTILDQGKVGDIAFVIENKLPGKNLNLVWKSLDDEQKKNLVCQVVDFLKEMRLKKKNYIYSVKNGKKFDNFYDLLADELSNKIKTIEAFPTAKNVLTEIVATIDNKRKLFQNSLTTLVHGDLIFHNLLINKGNLSGVLDWEMSLYGDPDYDIFRLMNFKRSAKMYLDREIDKEFEFPWLELLLSEIENSDLIDDKKLFYQKYEVAKGFYYLNALNWAVHSNTPEASIAEVIAEWK